MTALRESVAPKAKFVADVRGLDVAGLKVAPTIGDLAAGIGKIADTLDGLATRCAAWRPAPATSSSPIMRG